MAAGLLLLAAVIVLGWLALQSLHGQPRYQIAFADIDCTPPPDLSREDFLDEVQYFARLPDSVCVLDDGLPARLSAAFAKHPWVEQVRRRGGGRAEAVRVRLAYRTAVLRVQARATRKCAVDRLGVRLPAAAVDDNAADCLHGDVRPPAGQRRPAVGRRPRRGGGADGGAAPPSSGSSSSSNHRGGGRRAALTLTGRAAASVGARHRAASRWARRRRTRRCGGCWISRRRRRRTGRNASCGVGQ